MAGKLKTVEVLATKSGTFHDGTHMIVLREGKTTRVAESSLTYLRDRKLIDEEHLAQLDHDGDGKAGGSRRRKRAEPQPDGDGKASGGDTSSANGSDEEAPAS